MIELKGEYTTKDRWPLKVIKLGPGESRAVDYTKDNDQYILAEHIMFFYVIQISLATMSNLKM